MKKTITYSDLLNVQKKLSEQDRPTPVLIQHKETINMWKDRGWIREDKEKRMWTTNIHPLVNGIEIFHSRNIKEKSYMYIKDINKL